MTTLTSTKKRVRRLKVSTTFRPDFPVNQSKIESCLFALTGRTYAPATAKIHAERKAVKIVLAQALGLKVKGITLSSEDFYISLDKKAIQASASLRDNCVALLLAGPVLEYIFKEVVYYEMNSFSKAMNVFYDSPNSDKDANLYLEKMWNSTLDLICDNLYEISIFARALSQNGNLSTKDAKALYKKIKSA